MTATEDGRDGAVAATGAVPRPRRNRVRKAETVPRQPTAEDRQTDVARRRRDACEQIVLSLPWGTDAREVGYLGVEQGIYEKGDAGAQMVENDLRLLVEWGRVNPYRLTDNTRSKDLPRYADTDPLGAMQRAVAENRFDPWVGSTSNPMLFTESRSLANMVGDVADDFDVTVYPCGGQGGSVWLSHVARAIKQDYRVPSVAWLGDWDAEGRSLESIVRAKLERGAGRRIEWVRLGATARDAATMGVRESSKERWTERFADPTQDRYVGWKGPVLQAVALGRPVIQERTREYLAREVSLIRETHDAWTARTERLRELLAPRLELTEAELRYVETGEQ